LALTPAVPPIPTPDGQLGDDCGAAFTGTEIETNNPKIKVIMKSAAIINRAPITFMPTKLIFTFTSLSSRLAHHCFAGKRYFGKIRASAKSEVLGKKPPQNHPKKRVGSSN
jgi:hypothetical protein